jgi:hypothetical protein
MITQTMRYRQSLIEYSFKYGVTKAAIMDTRMGTMYLMVPKVRQGGYIPFS